MSPSAVPAFVSSIPERVARVQSGTLFMLAASGCADDGVRFTHLAQFLQWLTPLIPITKDDQRVLGLLSPNARPVRLAQDDELEGEVDAVEDVDGFVAGPAMTVEKDKVPEPVGRRGIALQPEDWDEDLEPADEAGGHAELEWQDTTAEEHGDAISP
jgi:hypothetical protein